VTLSTSTTSAAGGAGTATDVRPSRLHHVNLKTTRPDEIIAWYGTVLGMRVHHQFPGGAWLSNDDANHRIALLHSPGVVDDPDKIIHAGMHHMAFEYDSMGDLLATWARLREEGIRPHMVLDHGMTMSFYFVDPDGNSVELQADEFGDWAKSTEFVTTSPEFAADPIGKFVDPDQLLAAHEAGATDEELHQRAYAGEFTPAEQPDLRFPV
jgi:catechol 2,3-dioxygenase